MKILLTTFWIVPHLGGVWNYMQQLKGKLESRGHEVDMLGYGEGHKFVHMTTTGQIIQKSAHLEQIQAEMEMDPEPEWYKDEVVKLCEEQQRFYEMAIAQMSLDQFDLIHTQDVISTACFNRVRSAKTPMIASIHGSVANEMKHHVTHVDPTPTTPLACQYFDELEHIGATSAETSLVANQWLKTMLINDFKVPESQVNIMHYGYETGTFFQKMKEPLAIECPDDKKIILYTGRLIELKGVHHLITALKFLKNKRQDWVCWIAGDGEYDEELKKLSSELSLDQDIAFLGIRDDVPQLLSHSDIYVLPSLLENQPLSVIEAQLAGKPVIVSNAGGLPEMVEHGVTGYTYPVGDPLELSKILEFLLANEDTRLQVGINTYQWAINHWSLDQSVQKILRYYKKAMDLRRTAASLLKEN